MVAKEMALIHSIDPDQVVSDEDRKLITISKKPFVFDKMQSFIEAIPDQYPDAEQNRR